MAPSDFASADIDKIVDSLTTDEAILLTAGVGFWRTHAIERLGVPAVKVSDGPNGLRGNRFFMSTPAKCLPSATAMGATFDLKLMSEISQKIISKEARHKAASAVLGPTVNIQRNPLGGRAFESFSEDPYLSGMMAAAYIKTLQENGIAATIKHFVSNDKEDDRMAYESIMSERALREIYLMPFMLAQKHAQPWSYMTAYNRLNGPHVSENPAIIDTILRKEWGFKGMLMSDWFGVYSIDHALNAGLDLEMPGTNKWRTLDLVQRSIQSRKVTLRTVKERARKVLEFVQLCAKGAPEIIDGDDEEHTVDTQEEKDLMRSFAAQSVVLLKNESKLLPVDPKKYKKVAIIGGNAKAKVLSGGGSAALKPSFFVSPYDGLEKVLQQENVQVTYSEGPSTYMELPTLEDLLTTESGERGWTGSFFAHENDQSIKLVEPALKTMLIDETRMFMADTFFDGLTQLFTLKLRGFLTVPQDCKYELGLAVAGRAKVYVDGKEIIDNWTRQERGQSFFGSGSKEKRGVFDAKANTKHEITIEMQNIRGPADGDETETYTGPNAGLRLGGAVFVEDETKFNDAVAAAKDADLVLAVVGLNADWETEGYDRTTLALPPRTDELISKVLAVNPNTVIITQSGSAITMPWADEASTILHAWYLGNVTGDAIADVVFGKVNPSGRMSLTFPRRLEDVPSHGHFHSEDGKVRYAEDLFVGYKHSQFTNTKPLFAFGHGLSYTTFSYSDLEVSQVSAAEKDVNFTVKVKVTNTGSVAGSDIVQLYTSLPKTSDLTHPPTQLKSFAKVYDLQPGASETVELSLDRYAVSYWSQLYHTWVIEKGTHTAHVGSSSDNLSLSAEFKIEKTIEWNGI